jgi:hypothetical protein
MIKYENSTKNIYPKYQTFYRYRSNCDFVFPVNKIDREKGEKTIRS